MNKIIFENSYILTMNENNDIVFGDMIIKDGKILLRYHGDYEVNDGVFTAYEMDYDKGILKVYDINLDNFEFSSTTIEKDYCSEEVTKKYNRSFCFE